MVKNLEAFLTNLSLSKKFTLLLSLVFLGGVAVSGVALYNVLNQRAASEITSKGLILMETMNGVGDYTNLRVKPELKGRLKPQEFVPQLIPFYSAREVFENFRQSPEYREFFYKAAMENPSNLRDKADKFETGILERFRQEPELKEWSGFISVPSGELFYVARPIVISDASCLECHSTPDKAPKGQIDRYGSVNGFGWKLNQIAGAQIISVPASKVFESARQSVFLLMGIVVVVFAAAIFMVNYWLNRYVVQPLNRIAKVAEEVSVGNMDAEFEQISSKDEVGNLAAAFSRMKTSLAIAMKRLAQYRSGQGG
jgi:HAMP domain-containing protein